MTQIYEHATTCNHAPHGETIMTSLKTRLRAKQLTVGSWITLGHPAIAEIMAGAGFDWAVVDLEHSTISIREAGELIR
ncbi:MAG: 2 4-dihydroxyhept-2-ene-1 7-dioic acid, partial [Desulfovibrionaceae bacterium]